MSDIAIKVEGLSKQYRLGTIGTGTIANDLNRWWHTLRGKEDPYLKIGETNDRTSKGGSDYVWALKDIDFEVKKGDVLGIIGRNGAGKSTLLKILSRTTSPTTGKIKINGRIASLLEVGTGFHPDLSGRDNIFLNGAILGMRKQEIKRKFDEIVDFAGVERYIDTPVKRYSSGMYVRLAFGVAAHLEPEILIVDEVLAVGDAEFQKKCLGKMKDVSVNDGRTVLFVSHNMGAIQNLCSKALILKNGKLLLNGNAQTIITEYLNQNSDSEGSYQGPSESSKMIWFKSIILKGQDNKIKGEFFHDEQVVIDFKIAFNIPEKGHDYTIFCMIMDQYKNRVFATESQILTAENVKLIIDKNTLVRGTYSLYTFIHKANTEQLDAVEDKCSFTIIDNGSWLNIYGEYNYGSVFANTQWVVQ